MCPGYWSGVCPKHLRSDGLLLGYSTLLSTKNEQRRFKRERRAALEAHAAPGPPWQVQAPEPPGPLRLASVPSVPVRPPAVLAAERQRPRPGCRLLPEPPRKPPSVPRRSCHSDRWPLAGGARASGRGSGRALAPAHRAAPAPCSLVTWSLSLILQCTAETPRRLAGLWDPLLVPLDSPGRCPRPPPGRGPREAPSVSPGLVTVAVSWTSRCMLGP